MNKLVRIIGSYALIVLALTMLHAAVLTLLINAGSSMWAIITTVVWGMLVIGAHTVSATLSDRVDSPTDENLVYTIVTGIVIAVVWAFVILGVWDKPPEDARNLYTVGGILIALVLFSIVTRRAPKQ